MVALNQESLALIEALVAELEQRLPSAEGSFSGSAAASLSPYASTTSLASSSAAFFQPPPSPFPSQSSFAASASFSAEPSPQEEVEWYRLMLNYEMCQQLAEDGYLPKSFIQRLLKCAIRLTQGCLQLKRSALELNHFLRRALVLAKAHEFTHEAFELSTLAGRVAQTTLLPVQGIFPASANLTGFQQWATVIRSLNAFHEAKRFSGDDAQKQDTSYQHLNQLEHDYLAYWRHTLQNPTTFERLLKACNTSRQDSLGAFQTTFVTVQQTVTKLLSQRCGPLALQLLHQIQQDYLTRPALVQTGMASDLSDFDMNTLVSCLGDIHHQWRTDYQGSWRDYADQLADLRKAVSFQLTANATTETLQTTLSQGLEALLQEMVEDARDVLGEPPCAFALAAFGSFGRREVTTNSDLECVLLIADTAARHSPYFKALLCVLRFKLASLGESDNENRLVGFHWDEGVQPLLDNRLLGTPAAVAASIFDEVQSPAEDTGGRMVGFSRLRVRLLAGEARLVDDYHAALKRYQPEARLRALHYLTHQLTQLRWRLQPDGEESSARPVRLKSHYSECLILPLITLGILHGLEDTNTATLLRVLKDRKIIDETFSHFYQARLARLFRLRLKVQAFYHARGLFEEEVAASLDARSDCYHLTALEEALLHQLDTMLLPLLTSLLAHVTQHPDENRDIDVGLIYGRELFAPKEPSAVMRSFTASLKTLTDYLALAQVSRPLHERYYEQVPTAYRRDYLRSLRVSLSEYPAELAPDAHAIELLISHLASRPDARGYRESERLAYERLDATLFKMTQEASEENEADKKSEPGKQNNQAELLEQSEQDKQVELSEQVEQGEERESEQFGQRQSKPPQSNSLEVSLTWVTEDNQLVTRRLKTPFIKALLERNSRDITLKRRYATSKHDVTRLVAEGVSLHVKSFPDQAMMDYAIDVLHRRLTGDGTPANTLARLHVKDTKIQREHVYPLLISETRGQTSLREALQDTPDLSGYPLNHAQYTNAILMGLLKLAGDGASRNIALELNDDNSFNSIAIDNEVHFVEPIIRKGFMPHVQFCDVLFCLPQANVPLDKDALTAFAAIPNIHNVLSDWVRTLQTREAAYAQLFSTEEKRSFYSRSSLDDASVTALLVRPGVIGTLLINFNYLQLMINKLLNDQTLPSALGLLATIYPQVGHAYQSAFKNERDPEKRFQKATGAQLASLSSKQALTASLGIVPTFEQTQTGIYSLQEAQKELLTLLDFKPDFSKLRDAQGQPDRHRQLVMAKALAIYPHQTLDLSHCAVLTDELLQDVLAKSRGHLTQLNLRACPQLTDKAIVYLSEQHPELTHLYLSDNPGLIRIEKGVIFKSPLIFPNLMVLRISRCANLITLRLNSPPLPSSQSKIKDCPNLINKFLFVIPERTKSMNNPYDGTSWLSISETKKSQSFRLDQNHIDFINKLSLLPIINIHIWVDDAAKQYFSDKNFRLNYLEYRLRYFIHEINEIATISSEVNIAVFIYEFEDDVSKKQLSQLANKIISHFPYPLPVVLISVASHTKREQALDCNYIRCYQHNRSRSSEPMDYISNIINSLPSTALCFHRTLPHQIQAQTIFDKDKKTVVGCLLRRIPLIKVIARSDNIVKTRSLLTYISDEYCLNVDIVMGVEYYKVNAIICDQLFHAQIWDTSEALSSMSIGNSYQKGALLTLIFAPLNDKDQFIYNVNTFAKCHRDLSPEAHIAVIGVFWPGSQKGRRKLNLQEAITIVKESGIGFYSEIFVPGTENLRGKIDDEIKKQVVIECKESIEAAFEYAIERFGFWERIGRTYTPSAKLQVCKIAVSSIDKKEYPKASDLAAETSEPAEATKLSLLGIFQNNADEELETLDTQALIKEFS